MAQISAKQALDKATEWLATEHGMTVAEDGTVTVDGNPPLSLTLATDDERMVVTHSLDEPGAGAARADAVMGAFPDRGTSLHVSAAVSKAGVGFTFTNPVYLDGFSRQALVTAVNELVAAVDRISGGATAPTRIQPAVAPAAADPAPAQKPAAMDVAAIDTAEVDPVVIGWKPTHRVPSGGMRAWDEPDPSKQPSSRLEAKVELQIAEQKGDWAARFGSNGWTGWVDARKLEAIAASPKSGTIDLGGFSLRPLPLVGAVGLVLAALLPWLSFGGGVTGGASVTQNSFDIALSFLWDLTAAGSPYLGVLVLAIAALALIAAAAKSPNAALTTLAGIAAIAVATLFLVQMVRGITDGGGSAGDIFDYLGFAPWVMFGSGVVLLAAARK